MYHINLITGIAKYRKRLQHRQYMRTYVNLSPQRYKYAGRRYSYLRSLRRRFGLSEVQYDDLMIRAQGRCEICARPARLDVDHNHITHRVRGLLCRACNNSLAALEQPGWYDTAQQYLTGI